MAIFGKSQRNGNNAMDFLGGYLPLPLIQYIALYALGTGLSKNALMQNILQNWMVESIEDLNQDKLIELILERALLSFGEAEKKPGFKAFLFLKEMQLELKKKGIPENITESIIKKIKDEKN